MKLFSLSRQKNGILFFIPDYHSSFFLRDELTKLGQKASIYVPWSYPDQLLWDEESLKRGISWAENLAVKVDLNPIEKIAKILALPIVAIYFFYIFITHDYVYVYGTIKNAGLVANRHLPIVRLARIFGTKFYMLPSGCREDDLKSVWQSIDGGNVCQNCGFEDRCNDARNSIHFKLSRKHCTGIANGGYFSSSQFKYDHFRTKALDLQLWSPSIVKENLNEKINVLHSFAPLGRNYDGRNIKGSPAILKAIDELSEEGIKIRAQYISNLHSREMRFEQAKADIIVDQLIYGWFGSTALECMAIGKPVICYLNPLFEETFYENFPEYRGKLPIIRANVRTIKDEIRKLALDKDLREEIGKQSRIFAESWLDPQRSAKELLAFMGITSK